MKIVFALAAAGLLAAAPIAASQPAKKQPEAEKKPADAPKPVGKLGAEGYRVTNALIEPIQDGTQGSKLEVSGRYIVNGEAVLKPEAVRKAKGVEQSLRIDRLKVMDSTAIVQLDVSLDSKFSLVGGKGGSGDEMKEPVLLRSADEQVFEAVGYWYEDDNKVVIRYTLDRPIRAQQELEDKGVMVSRSRADQHLYLLFAPSFGVEITRLTIGKRTLHQFEKPVSVNVRQK